MFGDYSESQCPGFDGPACFHFSRAFFVPEFLDQTSYYCNQRNAPVEMLKIANYLSFNGVNQDIDLFAMFVAQGVVQQTLAQPGVFSYSYTSPDQLDKAMSGCCGKHGLDLFKFQGIEAPPWIRRTHSISNFTI